MTFYADRGGRMTFKAFDRMWERVNVARQDSDTTLFLDLLYAAEMLTKLVTGGLVAAIADDPQRHRYRQVHRLVRADGLGEWVEVINDVLAGPAAQHLKQAARDEQRELTQRCGPGTWQYDTVARLTACVRTLDPEIEDVPHKVDARRWFALFARMRNKTRGHGAPRSITCSKACPDLEASIRLFADNYCLFKRPSAYLRRNLSGKYRVTGLSDDATPFNALKSTTNTNLPDGVYVYFGEPMRLDLVYSDVDATDFLFPNGGFTERRFELISYITGNRAEGDATPYLAPASDLPGSETQGMGVLDVQGNCFANLPPMPPGYIRRLALENDLHQVLMNDRHPVITLIGRGGIGKTSLALNVLHEVTQEDRFAAILWFSARDIDLLPEGPKLVRPHVLSQKDIAKEYVRLVGPREAEADDFKPLPFLTSSLSSAPLGPLLFVFDNFETVSNPGDLFSYLDTHIRLPNKILITTRFRDFKGDFPVEVLGMTEAESDELIDTTANGLGIRDLLTEDYRQALHRESDGHPYVIKVLLGEVAKAGHLVKIERIIAGQDEVLEALFERTFGGLSPAAKRVFLTLSNWRSAIPELALEAVLLRPTNENMDVISAVEELRRSSFVEVVVSAEDKSSFVMMPLVAAVFGRRKLSASPMKAAVEADTTLLQTFGAAQAGDVRHGVGQRVQRMFQHVAYGVGRGKESLDKHLPMLEFVARRYPPGWLLLASLYEELGSLEASERAKEAIRHYLESPAPRTDKEAAWKRLAQLCRNTQDWVGEVHALVELSQIESTPLRAVSNAANRVNELFRQNVLRLDTEEKRIIVRLLVDAMEARIREADATDCSRLAWLFFHLRDLEKARQYTKVGLTLDSYNIHCQNLAEKFGMSTER